MISYDFYKQIEDKSKLAQIFNKVMKETLMLRVSCAPKTFKGMRENEEHVLSHFYDTCLYEMWMHGVISTLNRWDKLLEEYLNEYSGSWKFYAIAKRMDSIREFGGDNDDYNEDGSIKNNFPDEKLIPYSIIKDLIPDDCQDIVFDYDVEDLSGLTSSIRLATQIHFGDIMKMVYGKEFSIWKEGEDGKMIPMDKMEMSLSKISREADGEELALLMDGIICLMWVVCHAIKSINPAENNKIQLESLHILVHRFLNLEDDLIDQVRKINKSLE